MKGNKLEIVFCLKSISPLKAWELIFDYIDDSFDITELPMSLYGEKISLTSFNQKLRKSTLDNFHLELGKFTIKFSVVTAWEQILVVIEEHASTSTVGLEPIVNAFAEVPGFVQAWITDLEYDYWQNATDPLEFEAVSRSYEGLPMKSNGLPPPLEQMEIDTSLNPGRRIMRVGYVEAVGHKMWFGSLFWSLAQKDVDEVLYVLNNFSCKDMNGTIQIVGQEKPFNSQSSKSLMDDLRVTIFEE